jgi:hypothetical protein
MESLNGENRNNIGSSQVLRCCSFCRQRGHNIITCSSNRLYELNYLLITNYILINSEEDFKRWLANYSLPNMFIIKAFAIRFCGASTRTNIVDCIERIVERVRNITATQLSESEPSESINSQRVELQQLNEVTTNEVLLARLLTSMVNNNIFRTNTNDLSSVRTFIELIRLINNEYHRGRKFKIETNIIKCDKIENCECNICYETKDKNDFVTLNCKHEFCKDCIKQSLQNVRTNAPQCAFCRTEIKNIELSSQEIRDEFNELLL